MNVSRSLFCSLTMMLLGYVTFFSSNATSSGTPLSSRVNYEFCTVSQLRSQPGYSAVQVNLLESNGPFANSGLVYKGYIGRFSPTQYVCPAPEPVPTVNLTESTPGYTQCNRQPRCPGRDADGPCLDGDWVIVDSSLTRWCRVNICGSLSERERESLTVLCNTPDVVHSFVPEKDPSRLPAYNVAQGNYSFPRAARLCSVPWNVPQLDGSYVARNLTGMYFPAGPLADPYSGDDLSPAEICWPFYVNDGLRFFSWLDNNDFQPSPEATFLVAQRRDSSITEDPACRPVTPNQWQQPDSPLSPVPTSNTHSSQVNILTQYPGAAVNYCELVSANQKERYVGVEYPATQVTFSTTGTRPAITRSSPAGCKLIQPEGNRYKVVPVAFQGGSSTSGGDDADRGYRRMTVPTNYGWLSSTSYMEQYRAGCISRTLSANPYNLCRFTDPDLDERKLYGTLEDGSDICQAIALVLSSPSLNLTHIIKSSDTFEVFDFSAKASGSSALSQLSANASLYMMVVVLTLVGTL